MKPLLAFFAACALLIAGCGGSNDNSPDARGSVSGIVFDVDGVPIRDAHVYYDGEKGNRKDTQTNVNGVYALTDVPAGDTVIRVEVTKDNVRYFGSNVARILSGEQTMNLNIAAYPDDRLASIEGYVFDRQGYKLQGVRIFVKQSGTNTVLTSSYGITDGDGHYSVGALRGNVTYDVQVNALDYNSDFDTFNLAVGERRRLDFTVPLASDTTLNPPTGVVATAWTSPPASRDAHFSSVLTNIQRLVKPTTKHKSTTTRATPGGGFIEIDVTWDLIQDSSLLGYGIYRGDGGAQLRDLYFLRDPLAELFADMSDGLQVDRNYSYGVTTLSTGDHESAMSVVDSAIPLGDLVLKDPTVSTQPTFRWQTVNRATEYVVYLFNQYPSVSVDQIWDNAENPATSGSFTYDGSPLATGRTYYYIVLGISDEGDYTLSPVGKFSL